MSSGPRSQHLAGIPVDVPRQVRGLLLSALGTHNLILLVLNTSARYSQRRQCKKKELFILFKLIVALLQIRWYIQTRWQFLTETSELPKILFKVSINYALHLHKLTQVNLLTKDVYEEHIDKKNSNIIIAFVFARFQVFQY